VLKPDNLPPEVIEEITELKFRNYQLAQEIAQLKRMIFGSKSERFIASNNPAQLSLGINLEENSITPVIQKTVVDAHERSTKKNTNHKGRQPFPPSLPREVTTIYPEGYDENTSAKSIGVEVTEILEEIPGKFYVKRFERLKFKTEDGKIVIGELPSRIIEKGLFGEKLMVRILVGKYCDHIPLHREQQRLRRAGIDLPYSTIVDVGRQVVPKMVSLYSELQNQALSSYYIHVDETPHPVMDSNVKKKTHRGYLWVYQSPEKKLVLFDYRKGRGREGPRELLENYSGYLQTDGYAVYDEFGLKDDVILIGCMAHARRYFEKALDSNREPAEYFIKRLQEVYAVEREIKQTNITGEAIIALRKKESLPVLNELEQWMKEKLNTVTPKSPLGTAIGYSLSRWKKLTAYLNESFLEIDNNLVENAIRPTVLGRKNYMFAGSHEGAQRSAMMYSFMGSCKINGINPEEWLEDVLIKLPDTKITDLASLLPNVWKKSE
jgi:transposase